MNIARNSIPGLLVIAVVIANAISVTAAQRRIGQLVLPDYPQVMNLARLAGEIRLKVGVQGGKVIEVETESYQIHNLRSMDKISKFPPPFLATIELALGKWQFKEESFHFDLEVEFRLRDQESVFYRSTTYEVAEDELTGVPVRILIETDKKGPDVHID